MAGAKLSPRQRMINMMYLVLTALLALNVSKEVLNSFFEVYLSNEETNESLYDKNQDTYQIFVNAKNQAKVKNYKELAFKVKPISEKLVQNLQSMEYSLVLAADNGVYLGYQSLDNNRNPIESRMVTRAFDKLTSAQKTEKIVYLNAKEDRNSSTVIFNPRNKPNPSNVNKKGLASRLKDDIDEYRKSLLDIIKIAEDSNWVANGDAVIKEINKTLEIRDSYGADDVSWEIYNFYDMPTVAALTILSKWQSNIMGMEDRVISLLAENIDKSSLKFTGAYATVIPSANSVLIGNKFKSEIFITAFDKNAEPEIYVGDYDSTLNADGFTYTYNLKEESDPLPLEGGKGIYSIIDKKVGKKNYKGFIKILQDDGFKYYSFKGGYKVEDKYWNVSATKMNILYSNGVPNEIKVSVAGYQPEDVIVSRPSWGKLETVNKKKGEYIIKPSYDYVGAGYGKKKAVVLKLSVTTNGKTQTIGETKFRIKKLEKKTVFPRFGDGIYTKNQIKQNSFSTRIPDFDFEDIKFYIESFNIVCIGKKRIPVSVKGFKMNDKAKTEIDKLEKGQVVLIKDFVIRQRGKGNEKFKELSDVKYELIIE